MILFIVVKFFQFQREFSAFQWVDKAETGSWTYAAMAITNSGGIRTDMSKGSKENPTNPSTATLTDFSSSSSLSALTYSDLMTALPFGNTMDVVELQGKHLLELFEYSLSDSYYTLQTSGIRYTADRSKPVGSRLVKIEVLCQQCLVPKYEELNEANWYRLIVSNYMAEGGDGYVAISDNYRSRL